MGVAAQRRPLRQPQPSARAAVKCPADCSLLPLQGRVSEGGRKVRMKGSALGLVSCPHELLRDNSLGNAQWNGG